MKIIAFMLLLLALPLPGQASWQELGKSANGASFSYDTDRIKKTQKTVSVWTKIGRYGVDMNPRHMEINCSDNKYRILNPLDGWSPIQAETMIDLLRKKLCKGK